MSKKSKKFFGFKSKANVETAKTVETERSEAKTFGKNEAVKPGTVLYGYEDSYAIWMVTHIENNNEVGEFYHCSCIDGMPWNHRLIYKHEIGKSVFFYKEELKTHLLEKIQIVENTEI